MTQYRVLLDGHVVGRAQGETYGDAMTRALAVLDMARKSFLPTMAEGPVRLDLDGEPPPPLVKRCACGATYDVAAWQELPLVAEQLDDVEGPYELRNCVCRSTLAVHLAAMVAS